MSEQIPAVIGVILAGGQSSRMGQDKASLPIAGTTLLEFMRAKLRRAGIDEIVICRNAPGFLNDDIPQLGPLGALYTLSQRYPGRRALIIPVDMPLLSVANLQQFQAAAVNLKEDDANLPATFGQQIFPLYLPFTPAVIAALKQRAEHPNDLSIAAFLRETASRGLSNLAHNVDDDDDDDEFLNANTPEQWQSILAKVQTQNPSRD